MKFLLSLIKPKISIITDITQRYLESFSDMDELVGEYEQLVKKMGPTGLLIVNNDNLRLKKLVKESKSKVILYGLKDRGKDENNREYWQAVKISKNLNGQEIIIKHNGDTLKNFIKRFGQHHIYSLLVRQIIKNNLNIAF